MAKAVPSRQSTATRQRRRSTSGRDSIEAITAAGEGSQTAFD
eukprot:CAMPEP_0170582556 /NCGR_PEP_ID=MMETSP0224-20130122/7651_1 /TAXON_ID=285029 /ORGANISM="Togula jolla, Strain CCCM 725" /LENGTH=41 /DNA_ID= /DNA_START= /DNA_END= /DNA_ORIENTATION=